MSRIVKLRNLGLMGYREAMVVQKCVERQLIDGQENSDAIGRPLDTLILVEHRPVYTVGIRAANYAEDDENRLKLLGADFCRSDRGGLVTFFGPGQLIAYPVLDLRRFRPSVRWYVATLERTLVDTCSKMGIEAGTCVHTGVWVGRDKIGAIGIHAKRYVTTHGVALNCNVDLDWFEHIVPCGIVDRGVTSASRVLGHDVAVEKVIPKFVEAFEENFECAIIETGVEA